MPPTSSHKRPGIFAWVAIITLFLFCALVLVFVVGAIVTSFDEGPKSEQTSGRATGGSGVSMIDASAYEMGAPPSAAPMPFMEKDAYEPPVTGGGSATQEQRIIKVGSLELRVEETVNASDRVKTIVIAKGGYVEASSMSDEGEGPRTAELLVRVPVKSFEQTMTDIKAVAVTVLYEDLSGQDITEEFVDLEADLKNAKAEEASYLEIMKRSGKIEEVLAVAQRLAEVRGRIGRLEGRKRFLENKTDLATIKVKLTEETRVVAPTQTWAPLEVLRQAGLELVQTLQGFVDFLIRFFVGLVAVLPFLAFTGLLIWLGWKLVKMFMRRMR